MIFWSLLLPVTKLGFHYFTPDSKRASMQWQHINSPSSRKARTILSPGKTMATFFWDAKGVILVGYILDQRTMNSQYCSQLLKDGVKPAFRHKRRKARKSICLLQDNARPHTAAITMDAIHKFCWDLLAQPPYGPDLAPSDYHLFGPLKESLGGRRFRDSNEVIAFVEDWINQQLTKLLWKWNEKAARTMATMHRCPWRLHKKVIYMLYNFRWQWIFSLEIVVYIWMLLIYNK